MVFWGVVRALVGELEGADGEVMVHDIEWIRSGSGVWTGYELGSREVL